jgi:hypothetical protein
MVRVGLLRSEVNSDYYTRNPQSTVVKMPTPTADLQLFKGLITTWFHDDMTSEDIAKKLTNAVHATYHSSL